MPTYSQILGSWVNAVSLPDIPDEVAADAKLRILDHLGNSLAASTIDAGQIARDAAVLGPVGQGTGSRIIGFGDETAAATAAMVNGTLAHALDFDDTHNETLIHVSAPIISTVLTLGESLSISGKEALTAICAGREATCRLSLPAPLEVHERGFHATSLYGTFGCALVSARLLNLSDEKVTHAVGLAGSQAAGLLECFSDGTWAKRMHPGWASHAGIWAASLAGAGFTGPATVLEGKWGFFDSHLGIAERPYNKITNNLGVEWVSSRTSYKPYPCGHVIHQFIDALKILTTKRQIAPDDVRRITCRIAEWMVPIVCEPLHIKRRPITDYHAKFSLQYSVAAAFIMGDLGVEAYSDTNIVNSSILKLADRVEYEVDPAVLDSGKFKGWLVVETLDGQCFEEVVDSNWGSLENPMTPSEIIRKFERNARMAVSESQTSRIVELVASIEEITKLSELIDECVPYQ